MTETSWPPRRSALAVAGVSAVAVAAFLLGRGGVPEQRSQDSATRTTDAVASPSSGALTTETLAGTESGLDADDPNVVDPTVTYREWLGRIETVYALIDDLRSADAADQESWVDPETGPPPTACQQLEDRLATASLLPAPDIELATYASDIDESIRGGWILCGGPDSAAYDMLSEANGLAAVASGIALRKSELDGGQG